MRIEIPGRGAYRLTHLVLDVNGTVAAGGRLIEGVRDGLQALRGRGLELHWITADTRGLQASLDAEMGWPAVRIGGDGLGEPEQKAAFVQQLGAQNVVAVGNGSNDAAMLKAAGIGIAVLGPEGLALDALLSADLVAPSILDALEMVAEPQRLVATLRR
jgi:P-type E1-E2 ATPase